MNFDRIAPWYRWLEWLAFGPLLQRCRLALLHEARSAQRILVLGEGDGRCLEQLRLINPGAHIVVVDASRRMIELARSRCPTGARTNFRHEDARHFLEPGTEFDLVITFFFLDCFRREDVERLISLMAAQMSSGGRWLWADFQAPPAGWARRPARWIVGGLIRFFRWTTALEAESLVDVDPYFRAQGFEPCAVREFLRGTLGAKLWRRVDATEAINERQWGERPHRPAGRGNPPGESRLRPVAP